MWRYIVLQSAPTFILMPLHNERGMLFSGRQLIIGRPEIPKGKDYWVYIKYMDECGERTNAVDSNNYAIYDMNGRRLDWKTISISRNRPEHEIMCIERRRRQYGA